MFCLDDFPKLYARRCDTNIRFCQLNPFDGEAIMDVDYAFMLPARIKSKLMNALMIYSRYTSPLAMDAITRIDILEDAVLQQSIPFKLGRELSSTDVEDLFWFINEYKRKMGYQFISPHYLYDFVSKMENSKIHRLKVGMSWAKKLLQLSCGE